MTSLGNPRRLPVRAVALTATAILLALAWAGTAAATQRVFPYSGFTQTNGSLGDVWAVTPPDAQGRVIIGGDFDLYGQFETGTGAAIQASGAGDVDTSFPAVSGGGIRTVVPDGSGGFFIGGQFTCVGDLDSACTAAGAYPRSGLARILADGSVDPTWNPNANGLVLALAVSGSTVYVGGMFTNVGGQSRNRLAALDATTGTATAWNPTANSTVWTLQVSGSTVYVGGGFTSVGGASRNNVAAVSTSTASATSWNPNANGSVYSLVVSGSTVYAGGSFSSIGGQPRDNLAALDATSGSASSWDPDADGTVLALALSGSTIYAGGTFTTIDGQSRSRIAAIDASTGNATSWDPKASATVRGVTVSGGTVYLGGDFTCIGAASLPCTGSGAVVRRYLAAVDAATGAPTAWNPRPTNLVYKIATGSGNVFAGGEFQSIGGTPVSNLVRVDVNGELTSFPEADDTVHAVLVVDGIAYVGGEFACIGEVDGGTCTGTTRNRIAAIATDGAGALTSWNPAASGGGVRALAVDGSIVYAGGGFTSIGGQSRNRIAALDASTGTATAWNPNSSSVVFALGVSGSTVYAGGAFTSIGGQSRGYLAALDTGTGNATSWNPNLDQAVVALLVDGSTVYAGGAFGCVNGNAVCSGAGTGTVRSAAAAFDATGTATGWNPDIDISAYDGVRAMAFGANGIYLAGNFTNLNGGAALRNNLALVDRVAGTAANWTANVDMVPSRPASATLYAIAASPGVVFAGGRFESLGGAGRVSFGAVSATTGTAISSWPRPVAPTAVTATPGDGSATVSWAASALATGYTVTATPGGATCTTTTTSCVVTGLANGTAYTFVVVANGAYGDSDPSAPSTAVTPTATPSDRTAGTAEMPAALVRAGLRANASGRVSVTIACSAGTAACRASGALVASTGGVLGRFGLVRIASGTRTTIVVRLGGASYAALRASGATRVRVTLRTTSRLSDGTRQTVAQRMWLRLAPQPRPEPVTG